MPYPPEEGGAPAADDVDADTEAVDAAVAPDDVFEIEVDAPPPPVADDGALPLVDEQSQDTSERPADGADVEVSEIDCPNCYTSNGLGATHCRICGESLEGVKPVAPPAWNAPVPDVGEAMSTTWRIYQDRMGLLIGAYLLVQMLFAAVLGGGYFMIFAMSFGAGPGGGGDEVVFLLLAGLVIAFLGVSVIVAFVEVGVARLLLNIARGRPADVGDLFYGFGEGRRLLPLMLLVSPVILFIHAFIGGLGWMFLWPFSWHYVDRQQPFAETFRTFFELLGKQLGFAVLIGLIAWGVNMVVSVLIYPCCIGLVITIFTRPFVSLLHAVSYLRLSEQKTALDELQ